MPARELSLSMIIVQTESGGGGEMAGFDELREQYHRGLEAFIQGDPEPVLRLWSKRDDATLAQPLGSAGAGLGRGARGWGTCRYASRRR